MSPPSTSEGPPLGRLSRKALEHIRAATTADDGIDRDRAENLLLDEGFEPATAVNILDQLHDRGHLYAVDDELFVTDRDNRE